MMKKPLRKNARTTEEIRRALQNSSESLMRLAKRYQINPKTAAKWRSRETVEDSPMGPRQPHSTVLTVEEEAVINAFRRQTMLPLDDCFRALKPIIPQLSRTSLHRCFKRHGINRLPNVSGEKKAGKKLAHNRSENAAQKQIGNFRLEVIEVQTKEKQIYLFIAINQQTRFAYTEFHPDHTKERITQFVRRLNDAAPDNIHSIVTEDGIDWTNQIMSKPTLNPLFKRINK